MKATSRSANNIDIIKLDGKITIGAGDQQLREVISSAVNEGKTNILLDLSAVTTIDSSGTGELVAAYTSAVNRGAKIKLCALSQAISNILTLTQLITVFDVYDSEQEALDSF